MDTFMQTIKKIKTLECSLAPNNDGGEQTGLTSIHGRHHPQLQPRGSINPFRATPGAGAHAASPEPSRAEPLPLPAWPPPSAEPARGLGPALSGPARALPAHAQGASTALTPLRANGSCPAPAFPPAGPPEDGSCPSPSSPALPSSHLPPLRENTRPTIWRLTKHLERRPAPDCRAPLSPAQPPRPPASPLGRLSPTAAVPSPPCPPLPSAGLLSPRDGTYRLPAPQPPPARRPPPPAWLHSRCGSRRSAADRPPSPPLRPTLRPV
ncbi:uncharacterized protein LOC134171705 [Pezoporus occidentalis]|uniref:uncharacterized protein LOC134171705 n=1 Tax=Pezoporus occidentalis TaxID=407982 RepID=UPI002F913D3F